MSNLAVFFDRDGTLIHDPGYINHPDQVQVLEGVPEALKEFEHLGFKTVVASNQSGVARGMVTVEMLERIHDRLRELLAAKGATLDAIYYCPYHPEGTVPEYRQDSDWQKPKPGMLLAAAREMDLDLSQSWMIGDNHRDIEAGRSAGCKTILIGSKLPGPAPSEEGKADYVAVNMREAVNIVKRYHRGTPADRHMAPGPETGREQNLAAQSAQILSMVQEHAVDGLRLTAAGPQGQGASQAAAALSSPVPLAAPGETDQILQSILEQLRRMQKNETFREFSLMRLLAGVVQVFVPFCLLLALWFLTGSRGQDNSVFLALSFAAVLQLMALTFYIMNDRH
jgi:D-glycero-D-manno-heptose 1,7-bisphosphate phosphatase